MAETVDILNARVVVDASSVQQAKSQFNSAMDEMKAKAQGAGVATTQMGNQVKQASDQAGFSLQTLRRTWFDIIAVFGIATTAVAAAVGAFKALESAAQFRGMQQATRNMAGAFGADMNKIMKALDEASNSTLTVQDKFRLMNEAMLAGGAEVAEKLPQLIEIARAASIASGADFELVFSKLLLGIARGSAKLIDDARIYLRIGNVVEQYAKSMGIATEAVDAQTRTRLILNAVLEDGGKIVQDVGKDVLAEADAFKQVEKAVKDTWTAIKAAPEFDATGLGKFLKDAQDAILKVVAGLTALRAVELAGVKATTREELPGWVKTFAEANPFIQAATLGFTALTGQVDIATVFNDAYNKSLGRTKIALGEITEESDPRERAMIKIRAQSKEFADQATADETDRLAREKTARDKSAEIIISAGEKAHDAEQNMLQDMEELHIDHNNKLVDIAMDGARKREEIEIDYGRKVEDAGLDLQRAIEEAQQESANRRAQIEQRYQEKLIQIQRRFQDAYWNAVKNRDAVALVEAVRDRNRGIEDATRQRDQDMGNEDRQSEERLQNAQLTYRRKLEDAQRYYDRAMYDQRLSERRAIDDENRNHQYRETEISRHYQWRLDEIGRWLDAELIQARAKYAQSEADYSNHLAQMAAIAASYMTTLGIDTGGGTNYTNPRTRLRQEGGVDLVTGPTPFLAGEGGPELVLTLPMGGGQHMLPAPMSHMVTGDVRHQVDMITANGMRGMEGRIIAAMMQALREVYRR